MEDIRKELDKLEQYLKIKPLYWDFDKNEFLWIDTRLLPWKEVYRNTKDFRRVAQAIKEMEIRGAPAIGVSAAYGLSMALKYSNATKPKDLLNYAKEAYNVLASTRPTAYNLFWALNRIWNIILKSSEKEDVEFMKEEALKEAHKIYIEDIKNNVEMSKHGSKVIENNSRIITHCNTGALATAGFGTALGVIRYAFYEGKNIHVYADETRPLLQGARLTIWELKKEGIPSTLVVDGASGLLFNKNMADLAIVGADRITLTGHVANKIGTFNLALAANYHNKPFYVAAPTSTVQPTENPNDIVIEERSPSEVVNIMGQLTIAVEGTNAFNPAFDITPPELIHGIITEKGIVKKPYLNNFKAIIYNY